MNIKQNAIDVVKQMVADGQISQEIAEKYFPELKESEDERIRKELIEHVKDQQSTFISSPDCRDKYEEEENNKYNSWLAWLEKHAGQDHAWSEEDNNNLERAIWYVEKGGKLIFAKTDELVSWLKSLKPQPHWKPTGAQMSQLKWIAHQNADNMIGKELMTLYQDLQKLIE